MDWIAVSVIVSTIGIIVTIVITSRVTNKELHHNRFLQDRHGVIRLHEEERPKIYVTYRGARYVKADELLRSKRAREQIKALAKIDFKRAPAKTENQPASETTNSGPIAASI